jgi:hypothetical protein
VAVQRGPQVQAIALTTQVNEFNGDVTTVISSAPRLWRRRVTQSRHA